MGWSDSFWGGCRYVYDRACDSVVGGLQRGGNIASFVGGALFAVSYALDETLSAGYSIFGNFTGDAKINATALNLHYSLLETFDINRNGTSQGSFTDELTDYVHPYTIRMIALACAGSGVALKTIGATMGVFFRGYQDRDYYHKTKEIKVPLPSWDEYAIAVAASSSAALAMSFASNALIATLLKYSGYVERAYEFTHPSVSSHHIKTTDYSGPVAKIDLPVTYNTTRKTNLTVFGVKEPLLIKVLINGTAQAIYGAGVTLKSKGVNGTDIAPSAVLAMGAYGAYSFFSHKARTKHGKRLVEAAGKAMGIDEEHGLFDEIESDNTTDTNTRYVTLNS